MGSGCLRITLLRTGDRPLFCLKMPGAVAKLFGRAEGAEVPAKVSQGPVEQHQDKFKAGQHAPGKVDIYYLGVAGPPADFVLVDTKSGAEHVIPIDTASRTRVLR